MINMLLQCQCQASLGPYSPAKVYTLHPKKRKEIQVEPDLVEINGASSFSSIARQMASSGILTPTSFLAAYLAVGVPYLIHRLGNSLLAVNMKVYCDMNAQP